MTVGTELIKPESWLTINVNGEPVEDGRLGSSIIGFKEAVLTEVAAKISNKAKR